ncbi:FAD-dependent thiol oxidase [Phanerochaete sordida]|uniref:Sulfhydryl oxidase n=1 Tax=Phanerochaete sordida TaxID=48140 RepID=A0A9P3LDU9_9APHY|nr:FAD-dependent thiol oxidase [Phanerochaete sordida]
MPPENVPASSSETPNTPPPAAAKPPPGWVIGPDGKPCKICTAFRNWKPRNASASDAAGSKSSSSTNTGTSAAAAAAALAASQATPAEPTRPENCPPDVEVLGRATWTFLHTTAAYYPEKPTPTQRAHMLGLLHALPALYACSSCAEDFGERVRAHPPDVSGRGALSRWLCERHNEVNEKLGKKTFDCATEKLDERWKDGPADGSCD